MELMSVEVLGQARDQFNHNITTIEVEFNNLESQFLIFQVEVPQDHSKALEINLECFSASRDIKVAHPQGSEALLDYATSLVNKHEYDILAMMQVAYDRGVSH